MTSGGARKRSGPAKKEGSGRSDKAGYSLTALPAQYDGEVPDFPLPSRTVYRWEYEEKRKFQVVDLDATQATADREIEMWSWLWSLPQGCAWSMPSNRYLLHQIAMYCRTFVICESAEATAADKNSLHRFADEIGLTKAGLAAMGWKIAEDELAEKRASTRGAAKKSEAPKRERRLRSADAQ